MIEVAIDSSRGSSIALARDGVLIDYLDELDFGRDCDSRFLPCLKAFLEKNGLALTQVEGWTIGLGPGSFAGIRFSLALVKGICTVSKAKSRGVPSAFALARDFAQQGSVGVVQDARCGKVYVSVFDSQGSPVGEAQMLDAGSPLPACDAYCTPDKLPYPQLPCARARFLIQASPSIYPWHDTPDFEPTYVRPPA